MPEQHARLLVVSNRLPVTLTRETDGWRSTPSSGGLATAMNPILKQNGGVWIGWSGESESIDPGERDRLLNAAADGFRYVPVDIEPAEAEAFYEGYPNQAV